MVAGKYDTIVPNKLSQLELVTDWPAGGGWEKVLLWYFGRCQRVVLPPVVALKKKAEKGQLPI